MGGGEGEERRGQDEGLRTVPRANMFTDKSVGLNNYRLGNQPFNSWSLYNSHQSYPFTPFAHLIYEDVSGYYLTSESMGWGKSYSIKIWMPATLKKMLK